MTDIRRTVRCSNCGSEANVTFASDIEVKELLFSGTCRCGSSVQINYSIVGDKAAPGKPASAPEAPAVNIDESLFTPEIPSDTLRDLMDD